MKKINIIVESNILLQGTTFSIYNRFLDIHIFKNLIQENLNQKYRQIHDITNTRSRNFELCI